MFNLNEQIGKWRESLAQSHALSPADIDELESHLREEIESLKQANLSDAEAFLIAAHRLGSTASLAGEFAKINRGGVLRHRFAWMIAGILAFLLATHFAAAVSKECVLVAAHKGITGYRSLGFIGFGSKVLALMTTFVLGYLFGRLILLIPGLQKQIKQLPIRMRLLMALLVFLLVSVVYRAAFHIPIPGFRPMNIQEHVVQVLTYTEFLWSVFLPVILVMVLISLSKSSSMKLSDNTY